MSTTEILNNNQQPEQLVATNKTSAVATAQDVAAIKPWKGYEKFLFRVSFIFFIALSIPNSADWYDQVIHINWFNLHYRDLYDIARFGSGINIFGTSIFGNTLLGYANWIITLLISIGGALIWTVITKARKKERAEYNTLYYWLRAIVRYRAGIGIIGFGFTKLLPVQMPYPSLGLLDTNFGDFTAQKIYWLSVAIVPWYQIFAGIVEVAAGAFLFFRKTTTLGAALLFGALGDIVYVNFAYDGGVHVYSSYFVLLSAFLLVKDVPVIYNLLIKEQYTVPFNFYPSFQKAWLKYTRFGLKTAVIFVFLILLFWLQYINFRYDPYKQPSTVGVKQLRGNYVVSEFRLNNQVIPYNPNDTVRWNEATFENWTSLSYTVNKPTPIDLSNGGGDPQRDINRTFELTGTGGGRRVFHYYADTIDKVLYLQDKYKEIADKRNRAAGVGGDGGTDANLNLADSNKQHSKTQKPSKHANNTNSDSDKEGLYSKSWISQTAWQHIGNEVNFIDTRAASTRRDREFAENAGKFDKRKRQILKYETTDGNHVILTGINENKDSIYVVLDRVNKTIALPKSTLVAGKY